MVAVIPSCTSVIPLQKVGKYPQKNLIQGRKGKIKEGTLDSIHDLDWNREFAWRYEWASNGLL